MMATVMIYDYDVDDYDASGLMIIIHGSQFRRMLKPQYFL
jgi:hypothetical protein